MRSRAAPAVYGQLATGEVLVPSERGSTASDADRSLAGIQSVHLTRKVFHMIWVGCLSRAGVIVATNQPFTGGRFYYRAAPGRPAYLQVRSRCRVAAVFRDSH